MHLTQKRYVAVCAAHTHHLKQQQSIALYVPSFNILTGEFVDHVLDPQYYGGQCEYVYNGEWRKLIYDPFCENLHYNEDEKNYRKPYNFHTYRFMVRYCTVCIVMSQNGHFLQCSTYQ